MKNSSNEESRESVTFLVTPVTQREIDGTLYVVYGYFSPEARETATEKIRRLVAKDTRRKGPENKTG